MKKCLVVVDYQKDFVDGSLGFERACELDSGIAERIKEYRKNGDDVVFTLDTHPEGYMETYEGKHLPVPHCIEGTKGHELYGEVAGAYKTSDRVFKKGTFGSEELFSYLKSTPYDEIELCGVVTNICVISNAVLAKTAKPETEITVNADLCASNDPSLHKAALDVMKSFQINVISDKAKEM